MLTIGIILLILGVVFLVITFVADDSDTRFILGSFGIVMLFLGTSITFNVVQEKYTAIKCLKGNNPYKMEIKYEFKDSIYVPTDTIYIKIK